MKKNVRTIALVLTLTVMAAFLFDGSNAASLGGLNSDTAVAGASLKLESFFANNEDAGKLIASFFEIPEETTEDETEILEAELVMYEEAKTGYCSAKDLLNVRSDSDKSGTVLAVLGRGDEIELLGEITKVSEDGKETVWYAVSANGHQGFISGDYVKFGDEGKAIYDEMHVASAGKMPEKFVVPDDVAALPEEVRAALKSNVGEINWCQNFYQTKAAEEDYTGMYSTLLYISELYRRVIKTSNEYSLLRTGRKATDAHNLVATELGRLSAITNKTAEDFYIDIQMQNEEYRKKKAEEEAAKAAALAAEEAAKKAAAEKAAAEAAANQAAAEAAAQAQAAAEAAAAAQQAAQQAAAQAAMSEAQKEAARIAAYGKNECAGSQARAVADYAATFIGILPYVLGGASLTNGADCSGFIGQILAKFGLLDQNVANVHGYNSWGFRSLGTAVQYDDSSLQALVSCLKPGDVICYDGHVALYYGNGVVVHEPVPGRKAEWSGIMMKPILTIRRFASSEPGFVQ